MRERELEREKDRGREGLKFRWWFRIHQKLKSIGAQTKEILAYKSNMFLRSFSSILFLSGLITKIFKNGRVFCKKIGDVRN